MPAPSKDSATVTQLLPEKQELPLQGLYLRQALPRLAARLHRPLVLTTYLTDQRGVIATADDNDRFRVPPETRNASDWRLSQELMAQADFLISGGDYLRRLSAHASHPQDILYQFEPGGEFEDLGAWRLASGYARRSPDLAVVTHHLDFKLPQPLLASGRRIAIFTTDAMAASAQARTFAAAGALVLGCGPQDVDANPMIDYLTHEAAARLIVMTTGPGVLQLLLRARRLDLLYLTQVQRQIPFDDPSTVKLLLPAGQSLPDLPGFTLTHEYLQQPVFTADGALTSQLFQRYDRTPRP